MRGRGSLTIFGKNVIMTYNGIPVGNPCDAAQKMPEPKTTFELQSNSGVDLIVLNSFKRVKL